MLCEKHWRKVFIYSYYINGNFCMCANSSKSIGPRTHNSHISALPGEGLVNIFQGFQRSSDVMNVSSLINHCPYDQQRQQIAGVNKNNSSSCDVMQRLKWRHDFNIDDTLLLLQLLKILNQTYGCRSCRFRSLFKLPGWAWWRHEWGKYLGSKTMSTLGF